MRNRAPIHCRAVSRPRDIRRSRTPLRGATARLSLTSSACRRQQGGLLGRRGTAWLLWRRVHYRAKLVQSRTSEMSRLGNMPQDAGIKIDSVASSLTTQSARAMVEALNDGERRPAVLADLAKGKLRSKIPDPEPGTRRPLRHSPRADVPVAPRAS